MDDNVKPINELIELALKIAISAHRSQTDKMGKAYILHPLRVAHRCKTDEERIVAILHDTIEDSQVTSDDLLNNGFPRNIVDAVLSVTHQQGETYEEFVHRAALNPIGREVKIHDLEDNLDILRIDRLTPAFIERYNRYLTAYRFLCETDYPSR